MAGRLALVTGDNRGIGEEFARQLFQRGVKKVYTAPRTAHREQRHARGRARLHGDVPTKEVATSLVGIFTVTSARSLRTGRLLDLRADGLRPVGEELEVAQ